MGREGTVNRGGGRKQSTREGVNSPQGRQGGTDGVINRVEMLGGSSHGDRRWERVFTRGGEGRGLTGGDRSEGF